MDPDLSALAARLDDAGADGYLLDAGSTDSNQLYLSGFDAPDAYVTLYTPQETVLLVSGLEYGRARKESRADVVERHADYDYEYGGRDELLRMYADFLDARDVESVLVPERFPLVTADGLRDRGVDVAVDNADTLTTIRAVKTAEEIDHIAAAQRANEAAMRAAEDLIAAATVEGGALTVDGAPLTSERVKEEIEITLLRRGCSLDETIVACGADAADPHNRGGGPLRADEPIIVDIFPRDKRTKYHADMTRTFLKGEPTDEVCERFDVTDAAREAALATLEPGVTGAEVHDAVCDVYEGAGYPTFRSDPTTEVGFIHSTGHGIGLDVHELPRVGASGGELQAGHVVTIEPGLYDPAVGGVRIEDLVVVTEDGYENLTDYPVELVVE
ncbi:M24 family metallopeptidase [Haloferacaceae archaeon DSL9]